MVINVAIVDDEQKERRKLRECLEFIGKEKIKFAVSEFSGAEEFLLKYEPVYDVVFMDIQLGATDGIDAAKALRKILLFSLPIWRSLPCAGTKWTRWTLS